MFNHIRSKMKKTIRLKKKSDLMKFLVPCIVSGHHYPNALSDTGSSVSIMPREVVGLMGFKIEPSLDPFTFVDCSRVSSRRIVRNLEVKIRDAVFPLDFHVICKIRPDASRTSPTRLEPIGDLVKPVHLKKAKKAIWLHYKNHHGFDTL
ncbi:hypothetical protein Bca4012_065350 [Brassica carinata]